MRSFYSEPVHKFLLQTEDHVLGVLAGNNGFALENTQRTAWVQQIRILQQELALFPDGHLLFEYTIPRIGTRIDNVLIYMGIIFLLEFKVGQNDYPTYAVDQVMDYALDLKYFHAESHDLTIVPILISTEAAPAKQDIIPHSDGIIEPIRCNSTNIADCLHAVCTQLPMPHINAERWINSIYKPTPTIIEAAQKLYRDHNVTEISRSDAEAINLSTTTTAINEIIDDTKAKNKKAICFITGVPGAGKTLAGLNIANEHHSFDDEDHAVLLSGNGPLVSVLQEALARNERSNSGGITKKGDALRKTKSFIQNIHHFRDEALNDSRPPFDKVAIFDEAQRAWTREMTSSFMQRKKGHANFDMSEPEFLISVMDRHIDWAVIVCLIGGGQEINTGEAGLPEWFVALREKYPHWDVHISGQLCDYEYTHGMNQSEMTNGLACSVNNELHLSVSLRSFRSERLSDLVKALLDINSNLARSLYEELSPSYPFYLTRNLQTAKQWIRRTARGSERYGLIASSGAMRLKPFGICVQNKVDATNWFLNAKDDVRSSYYLEDTATEFDIQGLELDWAIVAWDADLRYQNGEFVYKKFTGTKWHNINNPDRLLYLKNSYRVLLTRARQGMIIFIPEGDPNDPTRLMEYYDGTYQYLRDIGINEI